MTGIEAQLAAEQDVVDRLYGRLDALRDQTRQRLAEVRRVGPSGSPQNRSERDAFATLYEDRLARLEAVEDRLAFGRLDLAEGGRRYIGRIGLNDDEHASMLTDWRAPAAQSFYRATSAQPDGVVQRRHLVTRGRRVTGVEDEVLDLDVLADDGAAERLGALSGEGALLAALAARRTGRMGDIVATIQAEQDAIIRAELAGALVVQGGPGTGKTAVALHRAAYLLYAHRRTLERSGVLLLGPSRTFLRYIDQVLPSLGETGVVSTTVAELFPGVVAVGEEDDAVAEIKGRPVWRRIVERAVRQRQRVPERPTSVTIDGRTVVVRPSDVRSAIAHARRGHRPHNQARVTFVRDMLGRLAEQYVSQLGWSVAPDERGEIIEELRTTREIRVALNLAWMPLTPQGLVAALLSRPARLDAAAPELSAHERAALLRDPDAPWTPADVPLLDEAAELLGEDDQAARAQARHDAHHLAIELRVLNLSDKVRPLPRPATRPTSAPVLRDGTPADAGVAPGTKEAIDALCRQWAADTDEPFVTLVARRGVIVTHEAFGVDAQTKQPVTLGYRADVASITKTITALLFARVVDQGVVRLDDPVSVAFPDYPRNSPHVPTFRQCLTHTSGLSGHGDFDGVRNPHFENVVLNGIDANEPGKAYVYSGAGFDLTAKAVETLTGTPWRQLYQDHLFGPLGIRNVPMVHASAGAQCTARDLAALAQLLLNRGSYGPQQLFSEETYRQLLPEPLSRRHPGITEVEGIGMHYMPTPPGTLSAKTLGHGSLSGTTFLVDPERDLVVIQLRRQHGPRHGDYFPKFLQTIVANLR